jgi:hypothetical protein
MLYHRHFKGGIIYSSDKEPSKEPFIHSLTVQALNGTRSISSQGSNAGRKGGDCPIEPDHSLSCRGSGDESLSSGLA